jgi:hypothetical protein
MSRMVAYSLVSKFHLELQRILASRVRLDPERITNKKINQAAQMKSKVEHHLLTSLLNRKPQWTPSSMLSSRDGVQSSPHVTGDMHLG